ncbi:MAG: rod shape-determining protein MreC [Ruminococcus sp.]|nr:rod shape-determining protein MreC [Ruminococcus sp.]
MHDFLKSAKFKVLLCFLAFIVGILIYSVTKGGYSLSGVSLFNTVSKPFRTASNKIGIVMEESLDKFFNSDEYYEENKRLKEEIGELNRQLTEYESLKAEVEELRELVSIKQEHEDFEYTEKCDVIGYVTNDPFMSFTIDKGSAEGVKPDCPVVTAEGLVGIIVEVSDHMSTVRTILSPDLSVAAVNSRSNKDMGIVEGDIPSAEKGQSRLIHINKDNKFKKGDLVITSGTSGLFPKDYSIGKILSISPDSNGISDCAVIEPCADISRLSSVYVITDFTGKRAEEEDEN